MTEDFVCSYCKKEAEWRPEWAMWRHKGTGLRYCDTHPAQSIDVVFAWRTGDTLLDDVIEDVTNFGTERL